ncbi:hypothetical protein SERLA73DRAFT_150268 [Serpula lacrymans var. lacrymans S7.3]|uniref:Uncharacterized protein n=1 Tax=Serpula lacrymans var. lacrymans (strain S7.3) TaxID=936435 RepID=F8PLU1_SERL3|nr:hypothetical protein SERLA73DRAFT_150268 [Serpula lacrymans var. lacrymans S7.3]
MCHFTSLLTGIKVSRILSQLDAVSNWTKVTKSGIKLYFVGVLQLIHINKPARICERTVRRIHQTYRETGSLKRILACPGRPRKLTSLDATGCIERQPYMMISELQGSYEKFVDFAEVGGFTMKKVTRPACKHDKDDCALSKMLVGDHFQAEQLVLAD